jgi:two-component system, OmpR family, sensor histidine kinase KdpD
MRTPLLRALRVGLSAGAVLLTLVGADRSPHVNATAVALVLVLIVLCMALTWGWLEALVAAIMAAAGLDYFFLPPRGFGIEQPEHWVTYLAFLATAIAVGQLSARASRHRDQAVQRQAEVEKLYRLADATAEGETVDAIVRSLGGPLKGILEVEAVAIYDKVSGRIWRSGTGTSQITDDQLRDMAARGTPFSDPQSGVCMTPVREGGELVGSIGLQGARLSPGLLQAAAEKVGAAIAKARAAERAREAEVARRSEELKSAVFDALAHEAKGPLNSIHLAATTLLSQRPGDAAQQREMLTIIKEEVGRIDRWIDDAIRTSRSDTSRLTVNKEPQDVGDLVSEALDRLRSLLGGRQLRVEIAESLPRTDCDKGMIQHVLGLLLDNAAKYSPPGSPIFVSAGLDDDTPMIVVTVSDAGPGIPEEERTRIFEKHFRGSHRGPGVPGLGLGLASAKHLVEAHGGEIWVTRREEDGAAFHFSLPVALGGTV